MCPSINTKEIGFINLLSRSELPVIPLVAQTEFYRYEEDDIKTLEDMGGVGWVAEYEILCILM